MSVEWHSTAAYFKEMTLPLGMPGFHYKVGPLWDCGVGCFASDSAVERNADLHSYELAACCSRHAVVCLRMRLIIIMLSHQLQPMAATVMAWLVV